MSHRKAEGKKTGWGNYFQQTKLNAGQSDCLISGIEGGANIDNGQGRTGLREGKAVPSNTENDCGEGGSGLIQTENQPKRLAVKLLIECTLTAWGNPHIYKLPLQKKVLNEAGHLVKCSFGKPTRKHSVRKIMVLGATGAGKTTLINRMVNYILGVRWEDNFRYKLIDEETGRSQAESQTSSITAYELHHRAGFQIDYSLTIIDTPGFGDTRGITRDKLITDQIREFFSSPYGVDQIDAVCFVAQASLARLTPTQKYIFDSILSIFGKDIAENIRILVTFADGQVPPVLEAINVAEVPCPKDKKGIPLHFKFNNSAIFAQRPSHDNSVNKRDPDGSSEEEEDSDTFDATFWNMGSKSMEKFFSALNKMETKSLCYTKEVLRERQQLEAAIEGLQLQIQMCLTKLEEIRKTQQALNQHQLDLDANKDFEYEVFAPFLKRIDISGNNSASNCSKCKFTCHYPCTIARGVLKRFCETMTWKGNCTVCPNKCKSSFHSNENYRFEYGTRKVKKTYSELKENYEKALDEKMTQEKIIKKLQQELEEVRHVVSKLIETSSKCISRLEEIALRPNPSSTADYIELLIQSEKEEAKPGYMERIQSLKELKQRAEIMATVARNENPNRYKDKGEDEKKDLRERLSEKISAVCSWLQSAQEKDKHDGKSD
ncbi:uncharacterized protein LOC132832899 [Hemiscyllium ocellatum]|uniref:uncharacterized protein LOC132832899 n=1 Tax=Hemiscyllium ocellatum TaxID=170820 RepID=UPI002966FFA6|nr:uncharacterized protein LOC132832899 [Hemiscyllium ocellatum]